MMISTVFGRHRGRFLLLAVLAAAAVGGQAQLIVASDAQAHCWQEHRGGPYLCDAH